MPPIGMTGTRVRSYSSITKEELQNKVWCNECLIHIQKTEERAKMEVMEIELEDKKRRA